MSTPTAVIPAMTTLTLGGDTVSMTDYKVSLYYTNGCFHKREPNNAGVDDYILHRGDQTELVDSLTTHGGNPAHIVIEITKDLSGSGDGSISAVNKLLGNALAKSTRADYSKDLVIVFKGAGGEKSLEIKCQCFITDYGNPDITIDGKVPEGGITTFIASLLVSDVSTLQIKK